jgi:hypothetical protein
MITDIIDLLVDASNTFGSLFSSFQARFKNYSKILGQQSSLQEDIVETICASFPEIMREIRVCPSSPSYVVVDKYSIKKDKAEIHVVFLDEKQRYIHSFTALNRSHAIGIITVPCFWMVHQI